MSFNSSQSIDIQGHRGCRGLLPENTIPAFKKAIVLGVHTLELDVVISKDGKVIVSHEPYMNPAICLDPNGKEIPEVDGEKYNLYALTYEEIKAFDCGSKLHERFPNQEKIKTYKPTLVEVFNASEALSQTIKYNIEIKALPEYDGVFTPKPKAFVKLVLQVIQEHKMLERCNLQSFDIRVLEEIKRQAPEMKVAILVDEDESISKKLKQLSHQPEIISPYYRLLDLETTRKYQDEGFQIIPWTVNTAFEMHEMLRFNVDGIITDYPDVLLQIMEGNH
ncbi:glycerophosphodiester phosphodiesterase [Lacinutrix sp. MEBiC02404]